MMDLAPYRLPEGNVQIAFSGGRTSAYMLRQIIDANQGLPDRCVVTFQNTGREMPQTLDFVQEVGERWSVPITWLEYRPTKPLFEVVSHNSASRNGEPFEALILRRRILPNVKARFCTEELKIRTAKRYLMSLGWKGWTTARGIRADEQRRLNPDRKERSTPWYPLAAANVTKREVGAFWKAQPFDLRLPNDNGKCWLGNCDGCFLKSEASLARLARDYPDRHAWWENIESWAAGLGRARTRNGSNWSKRYSRSDLRGRVENTRQWSFDAEGFWCQTDDGECVA